MKFGGKSKAESRMSAKKRGARLRIEKVKVWKRSQSRQSDRVEISEEKGRNWRRKRKKGKRKVANDRVKEQMYKRRGRGGGARKGVGGMEERGGVVWG